MHFQTRGGVSPFSMRQNVGGIRFAIQRVIDDSRCQWQNSFSFYLCTPELPWEGIQEQINLGRFTKKENVSFPAGWNFEQYKTYLC
jgi:hypothetical protein